MNAVWEQVRCRTASSSWPLFPVRETVADRTHQVQNNKDLDLPTQQELLAQFRCDEIAAVAVSKFLAGGVKDVRKVVERGDVVEGLGAVMAGWRDGAISKVPLWLC